MDFLFKASRWCRSSSSPLLSCLKLNSAHSLGALKTKIQIVENILNKYSIILKLTNLYFYKKDDKYFAITMYSSHL